MRNENRTYIAIDLKSFYASVECIERGLNPLSDHLVVADASRTEKTICLAVSPSLRAYGIPARARLFEVVRKVKEINAVRKKSTPGHMFTGESFNDDKLKNDSSLAVSYVVAKPRMAHYMEYSAKIYNIYLKYVAPEDIHVYSIDEVFMDVTDYLSIYRLKPHEFAVKLIREVLKETGITATAGIGSNLYLCKVAMDIVAKHMPADQDGARIAELDEMSYRRLLWSHRPLTDFWRVGAGYAKKLEENGLYTMGDIARCSLGKANSYYNEDLLYRLFGVNAELLIDHAWGWEPCTIAEIKAYQPKNNSLGSGQVLPHPYDYERAKLIVREMTDLLVLDLVEKNVSTDQLVLTVGYDAENLSTIEKQNRYQGECAKDRYGRLIPKYAHGTVNLAKRTSSSKLIVKAVADLFDRIVDKNLSVRRIYVTANRVERETSFSEGEESIEQLDLFTDYEALKEKQAEEDAALEKEKKLQNTVIGIKKKFGKNALLKGMNLEDGATTINRNEQIGGHKA